MIPTVIRELRASDMNPLYDIALMSLDESFLPDVFFGFYEQWKDGQFVACDLTGRQIGFLSSVKLLDGGARVMMFAVHPQYRRGGVGNQLLTSFIRLARSYGIRYITLEVRVENVAARKFYIRHGFRETDILRSYYRDGGDGIKMNLFLG